MTRVHALPAVNLWGEAADPRIPLFGAEDLPEPTAEHIDPNRRDDMAAYVRARAAGVLWYCPRRCTAAHEPACDCPCAGSCHSRRGCVGH